MPQLWGREWTRAELESRVGDLSQIAGVRLVELADGKERGARAAEIKTGSGFNFTVLIDRGLDISTAEYQGKAIAWRSMTEDAHPAYFEPEGLGWLRTFYGGLLVTCGMTYAGAPGEDQGQAYGLHGRVSHLPAKNVYADAAWEGDRYRVWVRGKCQEAIVFSENLLLTREVSAYLGENRLFVHDIVENVGHARTEHMYLYHVNIGFPAVDEGARLISPTRSARPRDAEAEAGKEEYPRFQPPTSGYKEKVYFHDLAVDATGYTQTAIANPALGHGVYIRYPKAQMPEFIEWKMMGIRNYVVGMEPANCSVLGRAAERHRGTLQFLEPGERREYHLEIGVLESKEAIQRFEQEVQSYKG
jgi:hypothetical protein